MLPETLPPTGAAIDAAGRVVQLEHAVRRGAGEGDQAPVEPDGARVEAGA
jgi:hypothetical protein